MEYLVKKLNTIVRFLKSNGMLSMDLLYRFYYMNLFGSKLYYKHKIESYHSCAFCKNLKYDKIIKKYVCANGTYEACSFLLPCIVPDPTFMLGPSYIEEEENIPWLFKETCQNFEILDMDNYFRNFITSDINSSVTRLEALEGILLGSCSGDIPCHICACVSKEAYTQCKNTAKATECGKCGAIYDKLNGIYSSANKLSNVS